MVQNIDRWFVLLGILFAGVGLAMGIHMAASHDHSQMPTHAHIMMLGWVFMGISGLIYRAWPQMKSGILPLAHFGLHTIGSVGLMIGLFLLYGGGEPSGIEPILGISSILVLLGWLVFLIVFVMKSGKEV